MLTEATGIWKVVLSILFFPLFFQNEFFSFAWGVGEPWPLRLVKWLFLLPAVLAFLLACWVTMASLITIPIRQNRSAFVTGLLITWWDLGRSVFAFWGGAFRFVFYLAAALLAVLKLIVIGVWAVLQDFILFPFQLFKTGVGVAPRDAGGDGAANVFTHLGQVFDHLAVNALAPVAVGGGLSTINRGQHVGQAVQRPFGQVVD